MTAVVQMGAQLRRSWIEKQELATHAEREIFRAMGRYTAALADAMHADVEYLNWRREHPGPAAALDDVIGEAKR